METFVKWSSKIKELTERLTFVSFSGAAYVTRNLFKPWKSGRHKENCDLSDLQEDHSCNDIAKTNNGFSPEPMIKR